MPRLGDPQLPVTYVFVALHGRREVESVAAVLVPVGAEMDVRLLRAYDDEGRVQVRLLGSEQQAVTLQLAVVVLVVTDQG